jgi:hypothetical protein
MKAFNLICFILLALGIQIPIFGQTSKEYIQRDVYHSKDL